MVAYYEGQLLQQCRVIPFLLRPLEIQPVLLHGDLWVGVLLSIHNYMLMIAEW